MRIGIDCRLYAEMGNGRYIRNLVKHLQKIDKKNDYFLFFLKKDISLYNFSNNFKKIEANFLWYGFAEQIKFPVILNKYKLDLMHFPHFNVPIVYQGNYVITIHDLIPQHFKIKRATTHGSLVFGVKQLGYKIAFKTAIKKSKKIITVSDYVRKNLIDEERVNENNIVVTKEAVDDSIIDIAKTTTNKQIKEVLDKFNIRPPFIYYTGNAHPHKNVEGLIKAFILLRKKHEDLTLVLSGGNNFFWQKIKSEFNDKDIKFLGLVSETELVALYKGAQVFILPSFEEGFGLPLLEAMVCCCPVVASNVASIPEVGGTAAIYFDPKSIDDVVEKISKVLGSSKLRKELIERGQSRYKIFSWEELAMKTLEVYEDAGSNRS